jgi:hypothetical protein
LDALEIRIRDFIDHRLTAIVGEHYWRIMPAEVQNYTKGRIQQELKEHPYLDWSDYPLGRARLEFCSMGHYILTFHMNWKHFADVFQSPEEDTLQRYLADISALRNALKHVRGPSDIELENGRTAIKWMERVLSKYDEDYRGEEENNGDELPEIE